MLKKFRSRNGFSLIETLLAIAILGMITVPLFVAFTNATVAVRNSRARMEANAVMRIIKENVIDTVKVLDAALPTETTPVKLRVYDPIAKICSLNGGSDFKITNKSGAEYAEYSGYRYDLAVLQSIGEDANFPNSCEYRIVLKKNDGTAVQQMNLEINVLGEGVT